MSQKEIDEINKIFNEIETDFLSKELSDKLKHQVNSRTLEHIIKIAEVTQQLKADLLNEAGSDTAQFALETAEQLQKTFIEFFDYYEELSDLRKKNIEDYLAILKQSQHLEGVAESEKKKTAKIIAKLEKRLTQHEITDVDRQQIVKNFWYAARNARFTRRSKTTVVGLVGGSVVFLFALIAIISSGGIMMIGAGAVITISIMLGLVGGSSAGLLTYRVSENPYEKRGIGIKNALLDMVADASVSIDIFGYFRDKLIDPPIQVVSEIAKKYKNRKKTEQPRQEDMEIKEITYSELMLLPPVHAAPPSKLQPSKLTGAKRFSIFERMAEMEEQQNQQVTTLVHSR